MNKNSLHTLVNFRASKQLLESFDRVCFLSGKTRTQVISEMMKQRVSSVGSKLASKVAKEAVIEKRIRAAVEPQSVKPTYERPKDWSIAVRNRLKRFSDFDQPER